MFSLNVFSQSNLFAVFPDSLLENANIIVKEDKTEINISSYNNMLIKKERIITVLNELGLKNIDAYEYFDKSTTIKNLEAIIYNEFGKEIAQAVLAYGSITTFFSNPKFFSTTPEQTLSFIEFF